MDEDVMLEAIENLLQKDTLSESEYNTIMESAFGAAFQDARRAGQAEFEFGGKKYKSIMKGETDADWKAGLAKNAAPPVPMARRADRPAPVASQPVASQPVTSQPRPDDLPVPGSSRMDGSIVPGTTPNTSRMVAGQNIRNDLADNLPTQVTQPATVRGYGNDSLATTIKSMFADRIKR
jgi:hypothetical protein